MYCRVGDGSQGFAAKLGKCSTAVSTTSSALQTS